MDLGLDGKRVVLTGATGGIGLSTARLLLENGASVAISGRSASKLEAVAGELRGEVADTSRVVALAADLQQPAQITDLVEGAERALGGIDVVVSSAGGARRGGLEEHTDQDWIDHIEVKPLGVIRLIRAALPSLRKSGSGRIIIIGGGHGREPTAWSIMGGTLNASVMSFAKGLSMDVASDGVTVNTVNPGHTRTGRWDELVARAREEHGVDEEEAARIVLEKVPLKRVIEPEEVAGAVAFLASAHAGGITGATLDVDGGRRRSI